MAGFDSPLNRWSCLLKDPVPPMSIQKCHIAIPVAQPACGHVIRSTFYFTINYYGYWLLVALCLSTQGTTQLNFPIFISFSSSGHTCSWVWNGLRLRTSILHFSGGCPFLHQGRLRLLVGTPRVDLNGCRPDGIAWVVTYVWHRT